MTAAQKKALKALGLTDAQVKALGAINETAAPADVPYVSCWTLTSIKPDARGVFSHTSKRGGTRKYRVLDEAEAILTVKANIEAGRVYAVKADA